MSELYDITIIGGGPVGLFTAFYANLRQAKVKIIDSLGQLGGQPAILYPEKAILDVPGFTSITAAQLTENLLEQLKPFDTTVCLNETLLDIEKNDHFTLTTTQGTHWSKAVIITMGGGAFKARPAGLEGEETFANIHYHVSNLQQYADQRIVVLGGGDSAVDWALAFEKIAAQTTLIHRRDNFRALEHSVADLKASSVDILTPFTPDSLVTDSEGRAVALKIAKVKSDETQTVEFDHLFVNYGFKSSVGNLKQWGLDLKRNKIIVDSKQQTSIEGIFAAGDCCDYEGKVELIATGFGEAPTAVNNAMHFINPDEKVQPKHSTSL